MDRQSINADISFELGISLLGGCMAYHDRSELSSAARTPRKRRGLAHNNSPTLDVVQAVDLGGLTGHLGYLMRRAQIWIFQDFISTLATLDIRPAQYSVLTVIDAISNALGIERARLVHLLNGLEVRKFVERRASATDQRAHALYLTAKGRSALSDIRALAQEHEQNVSVRFGRKNRQMLLRLLTSFASG
jgi:DNA-binding MarR family transcriptional regulator